MPVAMENDFGMVNTAQSQLRLANLSDDVICYLQDLLVAARLCCYATDRAVALHREGYFVPLPVGWIEIVSPAGLAK